MSERANFPGRRRISPFQSVAIVAALCFVGLVAWTEAGTVLRQPQPGRAVVASTPTPVVAPEPNSNGAMERANVQGTGVYVTKGLRQLTGQRWSFKTQDSGETTSPAVPGSTVYFGTAGRLYAVDTATGTEKWDRSLDFVGTSAPAIAGDTVYIGGFEVLYALDAETGGTRWTFSAEQGVDGFLQGPTVVDGTVYVGGEKNFYAVDSETGQEKWKVQLSGQVLIQSVPTVYDGIVYVGTSSVYNRSSTYNDTYLYALDSKTGQEKWKVNVPGGGVDGSVAVADGMVYVSASKEGVLALDARSGQEKWHDTTGLVIPNAPAVAYGMVYVTDQGTLHAIEAQTGKEKWQLQGNTDIYSDPVIADGVVYFGRTDGGFLALFGADVNGDLVAVDAQSGQKLWDFGAPGILRAPAVADGVVYFGSDDGYLYAIH